MKKGDNRTVPLSPVVFEPLLTTVKSIDLGHQKEISSASLSQKM